MNMAPDQQSCAKLSIQKYNAFFKIASEDISRFNFVLVIY